MATSLPVSIMERLAKGGELPKGFGDGWLSKNAADLVRIGLIAGFDRTELVRRLCFACDPSRITNAATVGRILDEMAGEADRP